jgi:hypothetical protein
VSCFLGPTGQHMRFMISEFVHTRLALDFFPYSDPDDCDIGIRCRLFDVISRQRTSFLVT